MSQLSVDSITGRVAGTTPTFPNGLNITNGLNVTGVITATTLNQTVTGATSFQGQPPLIMVSVLLVLLVL